jgi:predicted nucleic acid-binding protein
MVTALFDTNILIDHMDGVDEASDELFAYPAAVISVINWMEVACDLTPSEIVEFNELLQEPDIGIIQTSEAIMVKAAQLRGSTKRNYLTVSSAPPQKPSDAWSLPAILPISAANVQWSGCHTIWSAD